MKEEQKNPNKLYNFDFELKEEKKGADKKSASKRKKPKEKKKETIGQAPKKKIYEDEIIIGVTRLPERTTKKVNEKEGSKKRKELHKVNKTKKNNSHKILQEEIQENTKKLEKKQKRNKIIRNLLLVTLIGTALVLLMLSPIFNIQTIEIVGNMQVSKEELLSLSGIKVDENIFKTNNIKIEQNIKQNAYINEVDVQKIIPNKVKIEVKEREPSYMLEYGNGYVYINNQGYMLEISSIKKELPILIGISTSKEDYKAGNRLNEEDLIKLSTIIKIMDVAQTNGINKLITKIDISDSNNYILYFETEKKIAYLGDCSNLETRMLFLVGILDKEKENPGEIFINMNLNTDNAYFRESV